MRIMISAVCKGRKLEKFVNIVDRIQGKRCSVPQLIVNACLVYEIVEGDRIKNGLVLLKWMLQKNMIFDTISYSLVVFATVKMGYLDAALEAYCEEGKIDEEIAVLEEMETFGFKPWDNIFNHLIKGCSSNGRLNDSLMFCKRMINIGLVPSCSSANEMFTKLCENGKTKQADEMMTTLLDKGFEPAENKYSRLILGYNKDGDIAVLILFVQRS